MRTCRIVSLFAMLVLLATLVITACQPVRPADQLPQVPPLMEQTLTWANTPLDMTIVNAMSAGPAALMQHATILDWPTAASNNEWIVLRQGSNGWTCTPDDWGIGSNTPTNDPQCLDATWLAWQKALCLMVPVDPVVVGSMEHAH